MCQPNQISLTHITIKTTGEPVVFAATLVPIAERRYLCSITAQTTKIDEIATRLRNAKVDFTKDTPKDLLQKVHGFMLASSPTDAARQIGVMFGGMYQLDDARYWYRLQPYTAPALVVHGMPSRNNTQCKVIVRGAAQQPFEPDIWRMFGDIVRTKLPCGYVAVGENSITITYDKTSPITYDQIVRLFPLLG